jgi:hypothetical protein
MVEGVALKDASMGGGGVASGALATARFLAHPVKRNAMIVNRHSNSNGSDDFFISLSSTINW